MIPTINTLRSNVNMNSMYLQEPDYLNNSALKPSDLIYAKSYVKCFERRVFLLTECFKQRSLKYKSLDPVNIKFESRSE